MNSAWRPERRRPDDVDRDIQAQALCSPLSPVISLSDPECRVVAQSRCCRSSGVAGDACLPAQAPRAQAGHILTYGDAQVDGPTEDAESKFFPASPPSNSHELRLTALPARLRCRALHSLVL